MRCRGIADENQVVEHVGNLRIIEYLRSCSDFSEYQIAEPLQAGGVLFAHFFQVQNKQRFVQLSEHVFECAGMRFGKFKGLQSVFPGRVRTFVSDESEGSVIVADTFFEKAPPSNDAIYLLASNN